MREVLREQVTVGRPADIAWKHLAALEKWPSWAGHIRSMDPSPPGKLTDSTRVLLHMRNGVRTTMTVTEYEPHRRWVWEGRSLGTVTRFEHRFEPLDDGRTRIWFLAWMGGPLAGPGGWWFGRTMRRYFKTAFPKLKAEIEASAA